MPGFRYFDDKGEETMNKYQMSLINRTQFDFKSSECCRENMVLKDDSIFLKQNPDYSITKYILFIDNPNIESCLVDDIKFEGKGGVFQIPIDFDKKWKTIKFIFVKNLADSCTLNLIYVEADKKAYDAKVEAERISGYKKNMNLTCRTGFELVNVFWNNACELSEKTIIKLVAIESDELEMRVEERALSKDVCYQVFDKLAYGIYKIYLSQLDLKNNEIITDTLKFEIVNPFVMLNDSLSKGYSEVKQQVAQTRRPVCYPS